MPGGLIREQGADGADGTCKVLQVRPIMTDDAERVHLATKVTGSIPARNDPQPQHLLGVLEVLHLQAGQQRARIALRRAVRGGAVQRAASGQYGGCGGRGDRLVPVLPAGAVLLVIGAPAAGYAADLQQTM